MTFDFYIPVSTMRPIQMLYSHMAKSRSTVKRQLMADGFVQTHYGWCKPTPKGELTPLRFRICRYIAVPHAEIS